MPPQKYQTRTGGGVTVQVIYISLCVCLILWMTALHTVLLQHVAYNCSNTKGIKCLFLIYLIIWRLFSNTTLSIVQVKRMWTILQWKKFGHNCIKLITTKWTISTHSKCHIIYSKRAKMIKIRTIVHVLFLVPFQRGAFVQDDSLGESGTSCGMQHDSLWKRRAKAEGSILCMLLTCIILHWPEPLH